jgi:hypothetical protein
MAGSRRSHSSSREHVTTGDQEVVVTKQAVEDAMVEDAVVEDASDEEDLLAEETIKDNLPREVLRICRRIECR